MFLRNYYKCIAAATRYASTPNPVLTSGATNQGFSYSVQTIQFGKKESNNYPYIVNLKNVRTSYTSGNGGVIFGTGNVPPTIDDYELSGDVISTIAASSSLTVTEDNEKVTYKAVYTLTNNGDSDITVGEIAMCCAPSTSAAFSLLLERTVLDNPITIAPGGVGVVTYTVIQNFAA